MKTDCNFMNNKILHLKDDTNNIMSKRFGLIIDLDEMEESILKKCLLNSQGSAEAIDNEYQKKANELKVHKHNLEIPFFSHFFLLILLNFCTENYCTKRN